jgi:hypothetical protein
MRARQRGSITLEMILAIPVVFMLIWGGTVLSIAATARASLQMTAMRAARELAASDAASRLGEKDRLYEYEEFTETYNLPRPKVKMLVVNHGGIIVVGACYRVRLSLPELGKPASPFPETIQPVLDIVVPADVLPQLEDLTRNTMATGKDALAVAKQATDLWKSVRGFIPPAGPKLEFVNHQAEFTDLAQFDAAVKLRCGGRNLLLAEHAAFWSEKSEDAPKDNGGNKEKDVASLDLRLEPTEVTIPADAGPIRLPQTTATATVVPANSECSIRVEYSSGPSQAGGLKSPIITKTADNAVYQWTWNVGRSTTSGDWPVIVDCTNGKTAQVYLKVTASDVSSGV